jgi:SAM-dependent methyltransferase
VLTFSFILAKNGNPRGLRAILQADEKSTDGALTSDEAQSESIYEGNIQFWERAWNMCKVPYTQLPALSYLPRIPEQLKKHGATRVLDLGCGSGWLSVYLARQGFEVVGIDVSAQAINLANTWALQEDLKIAFTVGDIANLPYADNSFDAVVANSIFEHFPLDVARVMASKIHDILNKDGLFIGCFDEVGGGPGEYFTLADGTHVYTDKARKGMLLRRYSQEEMLDLFRQFSAVGCDTVDNGSTFVAAAKKVV